MAQVQEEIEKELESSLKRFVPHCVIDRETLKRWLEEVKRDREELEHLRSRGSSWDSLTLCGYPL